MIYMKKAVMLGAGNIGRGFIGMLLERAGYHVVFADVNMAVIDDINTRREYTVHLVDVESIDTTVRNISAINSLSPQMVDEIASCELVCTSVGLTALPKVAPAIAKGIEKRCVDGVDGFMNVVACENAIRGTSILKDCVYKDLSEEAKAYADNYIGFPDCAVDRIIPPNRTQFAAEVVVERYHEWDVERGGFKGEVPVIEGMEVVDDLTAYLERKLFTLNGPNAVTAYWGYMKGYKTINESLDDPEIYANVLGMMEECSEMLCHRHGFTSEAMANYRQLLINRFKNPYIIDDAVRVAREPMRKLSPSDRIIAPMNYAHSYGIKTPNYYTGIAIALLYDNVDDEQSQKIQAIIRDGGAFAALEQVCGIKMNSECAQSIAVEYEKLKARFGK